MSEALQLFGQMPAWAQVAMVALTGVAVVCLVLAALRRATRDPGKKADRKDHVGEHRRGGLVFTNPRGTFRAVLAHHRAVDADGPTREVRWTAMAPPPPIPSHYAEDRNAYLITEWNRARLAEDWRANLDPKKFLKTGPW